MNTTNYWVPLECIAVHIEYHIYYIINFHNNPWRRRENSYFPDQETVSPEKLNHLPQFMWLVRAFLHKTVWLGAHGFTLYYVAFQSTKWWCAEQRYSGGKQICQEAEFPIVHSFLKSLKERETISTTRWNIVSLLQENMETTIIILGLSLCIKRIYLK